MSKIPFVSMMGCKEISLKDHEPGGPPDGSQVKIFEAAVAKHMGIDPEQCLATNSCTAALHILSSRWCGPFLTAPRLTWPSSYSWHKSAFNGPLQLRFADVNEKGIMRYGFSDSLNMIVDLWGQIDTEDIKETLENRHLTFIVDAAHNFAHGSHPVMLKMPNCLGVAYSFYATKQLTTIRGGMALIPDRLMHLRPLYEALRDSGTLGRRVLQPYGLNYEMPDCLARLGEQNLRLHYRAAQEHRQLIMDIYRKTFGKRLHGKSGHLAVLECKTPDKALHVRAALICHPIREYSGVDTGCHYPVYSWFNDNVDWQDWRMSQRLVTLPCHEKLHPDAAVAICNRVQEVEFV